MKLEQLYRISKNDSMSVINYCGHEVEIKQDFQKFIEKVYAPDFEPNTEDENELIATFREYFKSNKSGGLGIYLKDLVPLKSKFPKILDPRAQDSTPAASEETEWVSNGGDYAWRGATMPLSQAQKLIRDAEYQHSPFFSDRGFVINQPNITYISRGERGFTSFSADLKGALNFKGRIGFRGEGLAVSVIYGVKKSNPNLILNPDMADSLSPFKENETLYVGDNVEPDVVIINDVRIMGQMYKSMPEEFLYEKERGEWEAYGNQWLKKAVLNPDYNDVDSADFKNTPKDTKMKSLEEIYTEIRLSEVGEGTSEPFKYKKNFERGKSFGYIIDGYVKSTNNKPDLKVPIKLQGLDYDQDIEDLEPDFIEFLSLDGSDPEGTLNGIEVIFSHADRDTFALVNDVKFMFRLMATIKQILQKEFSSSMPDVLLYSPTKEGSEAIEDTGRHRLYKAFIQKAFPSARMFVDDRGEEIIFKLK
jgi:hypothetical protein